MVSPAHTSAVPIVTLTTDFGHAFSYVAQMKGVILAIQPDVQLVDVTHAVPPREIARAAVVLDEVIDAFPPETIHVVVVDPGVGSDRRIVAVEMAGQRFVAPDNGVLSVVARRGAVKRIVEVRRPVFWRQPVAATFHGRDIMAPVAAHWSRGVEVTEFGPLVETPLRQLPTPTPTVWRDGDAVVGEVLQVDTFGNLISNIGRDDLPGTTFGELRVEIVGRRIDGMSRTYSDRPVGTLLALLGSLGRLEIAVNRGSACELLNAGTGSTVRVCVAKELDR